MIRFENGETAYKGAVLQTRERNGYHDSDFYAVVWDGNDLCEVEYASTRFPTYNAGAVIDATEEVWAQVGEYCRDHLLAQVEAGTSAAARKLYKGAYVQVVAGRKVPRGTTGILFWIGSKTKYTHHATPTRKGGIATSDVKVMREGKDGKSYESYRDIVWVPNIDRNLEVINADQFITPQKSSQIIKHIMRLSDEQAYAAYRRAV